MYVRAELFAKEWVCDGQRPARIVLHVRVYVEKICNEVKRGGRDEGYLDPTALMKYCD